MVLKGRGAGRIKAQQFTHLRGQRDGFRAARERATAARNEFPRVVVQEERRQRKQPRAFGEAPSDVRCRIQEYMPVIERCDQADVP